MIELAPDDARLGMAGLAGFARTADWWEPMRLPAPAALLHPELLLTARMAAGGRFSFTTDATAVTLPIRAQDPADTAPVDLCVDGALAHRLPVRDTLHVDLPAGRKRIDLWLPQFGVVQLGRMRLDGDVIEPEDPRGARWIHYGSSISQCRTASGPSQTWPALVATRQDWQLRCWGFAGQCHLDPVVARCLRDTPAELISLCLGVNIHGAATFSHRSLGPAVIGFCQTVRDEHPDTPLALITPITAPGRERTPNAAGLTLEEVRDIVRSTGELLIAAGDRRLTIIDGPDILGPADAGLLGDGLHPTAEGYRVMAERLAGPLAATLAIASPAGR
jgi:hypothetical protein